MQCVQKRPETSPKPCSAAYKFFTGTFHSFTSAILNTTFLEGSKEHTRKGHREKQPENTRQLPEYTLQTPRKYPEIHDFQYFFPMPFLGMPFALNRNFELLFRNENLQAWPC